MCLVFDSETLIRNAVDSCQSNLYIDLTDIYRLCFKIKSLLLQADNSNRTYVRFLNDYEDLEMFCIRQKDFILVNNRIYFNKDENNELCNGLNSKYDLSIQEIINKAKRSLFV